MLIAFVFFVVLFGYSVFSAEDVEADFFKTLEGDTCIFAGDNSVKFEGDDCYRPGAVGCVRTKSSEGRRVHFFYVIDRQVMISVLLCQRPCSR